MTPLFALILPALLAASPPRGIHRSPSPPGSAALSWRTSSPAAESWVEVEGVGVFEARTIGSEQHASLGMSFYHHVLIDRLEPALCYYLTLRPDGTRLDLRTAPIEQRVVRFTAAGDIGTKPSSARVARLRAEWGADLHLLLGDLSYANDAIFPWSPALPRGERIDWWRVHDKFWNQQEPLCRDAVCAWIPGNHERREGSRGKGPQWGVRSTSLRSPLPAGRTYYMLRRAHTAIIMLDSTVPTQHEMRAQRTWLESILSFLDEDESCVWIVVAVHRPIRGQLIDRRLQRSLSPLLEAFGVALVLSGDRHQYERSHPLGASGWVQIVAGIGGRGQSAPIHDPAPDLAAWSRGPGFVGIETDPTRLSVQAYDIGGREIDRFQISARSARPSRPTIDEEPNRAQSAADSHHELPGGANVHRIPE